MLKNKFITLIYAVAVVVSLAGCQTNNSQSTSNQSVFAGGSGTILDPYQIETAEQLQAIKDNLSCSYVLNADIDLNGVEFEPLGVFELKSDDEEDAETPNTEAAFTGHFDGNNHTISNMVINEPDKNGIGLFGCITGENSGIVNLTVSEISVTGGMYTGGVVGFNDVTATVDSITMTGENSVKGTFLTAGVVGASFGNITNCTAKANIELLGDNAQGAGIIVGGLEGGNLENCNASGEVIAHNGAYSIGGLAGCAHTSEYIKNCFANDITVAVGDNCWLIGGLAGHAGTFEGNPTEISSSTVSNVRITTGGNSERIGGIIGGGFYGSSFKQYYPTPAAIKIAADCSVTDFTVTGGKIVGAALGYSYDNSTVDDNCEVSMLWNDTVLTDKVGGDNISVPLESLL